MYSSVTYSLPLNGVLWHTATNTGKSQTYLILGKMPIELRPFLFWYVCLGPGWACLSATQYWNNHTASLGKIIKQQISVSVKSNLFIKGEMKWTEAILAFLCDFTVFYWILELWSSNFKRDLADKTIVINVLPSRKKGHTVRLQAFKSFYAP